MHDKMIVKLFTLLKDYGHNYRVNIACKQSPKSSSLMPSCWGSQWISVHSSPGQHEVYNHKWHTHLGYYIQFKVVQTINAL